MANLNRKIALVTGASKGIGAGIAKSLAREGATVIVNYATDKAGAERTVADITAAGGKALALGGSVARESDVHALLDAIRKQFGRLDILVNNAGVYKFAPVGQFTAEDIDWMFGTNVKGLLLTTQAAAELFPAEGGSVINIGSVVSETTPVQTTIYTATKGAVDAITRVLARELGPRNIRVNSVNPGLVATEGSTGSGIIGSDFEHQAVAQTPLGRTGKPDDIGDVVAFLASDHARWVTGALLQAGGGLR